jgi:poly-beta-1,6-N-acetyl-D-glucosamine N-deacetylase
MITLIPKNRNAFTSSKGKYRVLIWALCALSGLLPGLALAESSPKSEAAMPSNSKTGGASSTMQLGEQVWNLANSSVMFPSLISHPSWSAKSFVEEIGPLVSVFLNRSRYPYINERAKLARVPILMYHDILPKKEVSWDVTPGELEEHFQLLKSQGVTPISIDYLTVHLQTGVPLPEKPVVLTFDDGYGGHYEHVFPLLKKYGYPAVFSIYTDGVGNNTGRTHVSWEQLKEMAVNPLVTIASHTITHPSDLRKVSNEQLHKEIIVSKQILEKNLGIPIRYFTYPVGKYDAREIQYAYVAGYQLALTMSDTDERYAGASDNLFAVSRFGQSSIKKAIAEAWSGAKLPRWKFGFDFSSPIEVTKTTIDKIDLALISGGKPITIHADSRYDISEILAKSGTNAIAAVDGGFFSLKSLNSNVMIGPVYSQTTKQFIPGSNWDIQKIAGRPLVLISPGEVRFIPFDPNKHNSLTGVQAEMPSVTDAFVAAAWLVKDGQPQAASTFNGLFGFEAARYRAFWGVNKSNQPAIGASRNNTDAVSLGAALTKAGLQDAVMLDSGQSTSLVYKGQSLINHTPRPVPHAIALLGS